VLSRISRIFGSSAFSATLRWKFLFLVVSAMSPAASHAQEIVVHLDPANTTIDFTLGATMHTVHGTFKMTSGEIDVNEVTGRASGTIVVDATSGNSDNGSRDDKMNKGVLDSAKYREIVFSPATLTAVPGHTLKETLEAKGTTELRADGLFSLHGQEHDITLDLAIRNNGNGGIQVSGNFPIPYIKWGLKSPNTFLLHVNDTVDLTIHATGHVVSGR
jgi:polyisoprenoid-binding protein YceI